MFCADKAKLSLYLDSPPYIGQIAADVSREQVSPAFMLLAYLYPTT